MVASLISQKIDWILPCLAIWDIITDRMLLRQNRTKCMNTTYFSYHHSSTNKSVNLLKRQAIADQHTVKLLLVLNDSSTTQLYLSTIRANKTPNCRETPQLIDVPSLTTMEINVFITILAIHFLWNYGWSLVLSDLTYIYRLISWHYVSMPLLILFNKCTWKFLFRHIT